MQVVCILAGSNMALVTITAFIKLEASYRRQFSNIKPSKQRYKSHQLTRYNGLLPAIPIPPVSLIVSPLSPSYLPIYVELALVFMYTYLGVFLSHFRPVRISCVDLDRNHHRPDPPTRSCHCIHGHPGYNYFFTG